MSFYGPELARIHDEGFGYSSEHAAVLLAEELQPGDGTGRQAVDLGCGTGILAELLIQRGYSVLGVDASRDSLALAAAKAPTAQFIEASLFDVRIPACDLVTLVGECINYCNAVEPSAAGLRELLQRVYDALRPGGLLLFDSAGPGRAPADFWLRKWSQDREGEWAMLFEAQEDPAAQKLERRIISFTREPDSAPGAGLYRRSEEVHHLRLWPSGELLALLNAAGFTAETRSGYVGNDLPQGMTVFICKR